MQNYLEPIEMCQNEGESLACSSGRAPAEALAWPQATPYIVIHLEASETDQPVDGDTIVKFINKFMGDTHAILFTGHRRTPYLDGIARAVVHGAFHDTVGQLSSGALRSAIQGAEAVATVNGAIFQLADQLGTPVLMLDATAACPLKPWSQNGFQLGFQEHPLTPYQVCDALAYLLSLSAKNPVRNSHPS